MEKQKNIPALRFPEFEDEWDNKRIEDVAQIKYGKDQKQVSCENGKFPILGTGGEMGRTNSFLYDKPSVLIGRKGTIDKPRFMQTPFWTVDTLFYTQIYSNTFPNWLFYKFETINWYLYNEASGVPSLSSSTIYKIQIKLPTFSEQQKIAEFLSAVDDKINQLNEKKTLLEQYKKGVMQKIFSQEIRFKDENGKEFPKWEKKRLGDLLIDTIDNRGKTPPVTSEGIPLLEVNSIGKRDINYKAVTKFVSESTYNNWFRKYLIRGDILFSTVGNTAICSFYNGKCIANIAQNIVGLRFKQDLGLFMFYLLTEERNNNKFKQIEMGAVQPSVKVSQMIELFFKIPSYHEQIKISNFLFSVDDKINLVNEQIEKTEVWKKGLLQKMFC